MHKNFADSWRDWVEHSIDIASNPSTSAFNKRKREFIKAMNDSSRFGAYVRELTQKLGQGS